MDRRLFLSSTAAAAAAVTSQVAVGAAETPTLRGLPATAPYTHDGSLATLRDVVRHYSALDLDRLHADGEALLKPLKLSDAEIDDLVAFLESLGAPVGRTAAAKAGDEQGQEKKE